MTDYEQAYRDLRAGVEALADEWETAHGDPPVDPSHISVRHAKRLHALLASSAPATASEGTEEQEAVDRASLVFGWQHLARYSGQSGEWLEATLTAMVRAVLAARTAQPEGVERVEWGVRVGADVRVMDPRHVRYQASLSGGAEVVRRTVTTYAPVVGPWVAVEEGDDD